VARKHPQLVREIADAGHELGSHSYWHRQVTRQSPDEFRRDLRDSRAAVEDAAGLRVTLYRAPTFSITRDSLWALEILAEEGFRGDSSIFPIRHDRYGIPQAERRPHVIATRQGDLVEFPMSVVAFAGQRIPIGGGGYFRMYPLGWTVRGLRAVNRRQRLPFMFYIHPWEVDPEQPVVRGPRARARARHRLNLSRTAGKLAGLLRTFRCGTVTQTLDAFVAQSGPLSRLRLEEIARPSSTAAGPSAPRMASLRLWRRLDADAP
jgi:polysaccharide deacetylase family protein (PEP-CTERM system associated)